MTGLKIPTFTPFEREAPTAQQNGRCTYGEVHLLEMRNEGTAAKEARNPEKLNIPASSLFFSRSKKSSYLIISINSSRFLSICHRVIVAE